MITILLKPLPNLVSWSACKLTPVGISLCWKNRKVHNDIQIRYKLYHHFSHVYCAWFSLMLYIPWSIESLRPLYSVNILFSLSLPDNICSTLYFNIFQGTNVTPYHSNETHALKTHAALKGVMTDAWYMDFDPVSSILLVSIKNSTNSCVLRLVSIFTGQEAE